MTHNHTTNRILVSACLLGEPLRYDGRDNQFTHPLLDQWRAQERIVPFCPETAGGLPVPRPPAEFRNGRVVTADGEDLTDAFERGAALALALCREQHIRVALLAARSPSCGNDHIYDGSFSGRLVDGMGVTARRLREAGISVFNPEQISEAAHALARIEEQTL